MPKGKKSEKATKDPDPAYSEHSSSSDELTDVDKDVDMSDDKQEFLDKLTIFKMIHEKECEDGKDVSKESRINDLNELKALYDNLNYDISFAEFVIRSSLVRWVTYREDMRYWNLWDKKEELMKKHRRSKERERDRRRSLDRRMNDRDKSRSRSRSRSRMRDILGDNSGDKDDGMDNNKEHVK